MDRSSTVALWDLPLHHLHFNLRAARGGVRPGRCRHCLGVVLVVRQRELGQELGPLVLSPWREGGLMDLGRVVRWSVASGKSFVLFS